MKVRRAVGCICICEDKIVLVKKIGTSDGTPIEPFWGLPIGGIREGETEIEACQRELKEETSIVAENFEPFGEMQYTYENATGKVLQKVRVYRANIESTVTIKPQDAEIEQGRWVTIDEALALAKHQNTTELLRKVNP